MDFAIFVVLAPAIAIAILLAMTEGAAYLAKALSVLERDEVGLSIVAHSLIHLSTLGVAVVGGVLTGFFHLPLNKGIASAVGAVWFIAALRLAYLAEHAREKLHEKRQRDALSDNANS